MRKIRKDIHGKVVKVGDKVRGFGFLEYQDNFKTSRSPTVTVREDGGVLRFGKLSADSFPTFEIVEEAPFPETQECVDYKSRWGCDVYCAVLQRGECPLKDTVNKELHEDYIMLIKNRDNGKSK